MLLRRTFLFSRRFFSTKDTHNLSSSIAEFNKELEDIFGEPLASGPSGSTDNHTISHEKAQVEVSDVPGKLPHIESHENAQLVSSPSDSTGNRTITPENRLSEVFDAPVRLTHIGSHGKAQMVDVSPKIDTKRTAIASCKVILGKKVFDLVSANQLAKGDVLSVAKIAGITGAKQTANLIPLCHNISLSHVHVDLALNASDYSVVIKGEASTTGKTGVEMEAMTAVTIAGLTVYDMCKAASKHIEITKVRLERKSGGKSGEWSREE